MFDYNFYEYAVKIMNKIKPFIAIIILIFIVLSFTGLYNHNKLLKEIKTYCGYENKEKVFCVCDKKVVSNIYTDNNPYINKSKNVNFSIDTKSLNGI